MGKIKNTMWRIKGGGHKGTTIQPEKESPEHQ